MALKPTNNESGLLTALLTVIETTSIHLDPVPELAPGVIVMEPGTANEEHIYYKTRDAVGGTVSGLVRDYTNLNGGVGIQHENNSAWENLQSSEYIQNLVDIVLEGFFEEFNTIEKVDAATFTVATDRTYYYSANRVVRFNVDNAQIGIVASSSYNAGTGLTTVIINYGTVPTLTNVELAIQPNAATAQMVTGSSVQAGGSNYALSTGSANAYIVALSPIPSALVTGQRVYFKANFTNTAAPTINVNSLGAKSIVLANGNALMANTIRSGQMVELEYDGTNFQLLSTYQTNEWIDLTDGATINIDLALGRKFRVKAMGGNRAFTISNIPTLTGFMFLLQIWQDGTGSRTVTSWFTGDSTFATTDVNTTDNIITVGTDIPTGTPIKFSSTTTVPAGLTAGTKYYAIRQSATTIKVASSLANAQAGTAIDITDAGTGTHTCLRLIRWPGDTEPTLTTGKNRVDTFAFEEREYKVFAGGTAFADN